MIDHRSYTNNLSSCEIQTRKNRIGTHDLNLLRHCCSALPTQLSSHMGDGHSGLFIQALIG